MKVQLDKFAAILLDCDGVLYRGGKAVAGAADAVAQLRSKTKVGFVTNNSTKDQALLTAALKNVGIEAEREEMVSSATAVAAHLGASLAKGSRVLVVGSEALASEINKAGLEATRCTPGGSDGGDDDAFAAVAVGLCRDFDYAMGARGSAAIMAGAKFIAANRDPTLPMPGRLLPGTGPVVGFIEITTGVSPFYCGKPTENMGRLVSKVLGVPRGGRVLFVGDRLDTDIAFGIENGWETLLVLTGASCVPPWVYCVLSLTRIPVRCAYWSI